MCQAALAFEGLGINRMLRETHGGADHKLFESVGDLNVNIARTNTSML
jgi:hypothetical protein